MYSLKLAENFTDAFKDGNLTILLLDRFGFMYHSFNDLEVKAFSF